ncbi:ZIP family metal transporter [Granulicella mallensis]|uniref:zinc permease n=1 Tax=Granulicella mallensis TaxID=940614 RepID=UPI0002E55526|nr:zinc permease [Granulicella mallensis]
MPILLLIIPVLSTLAGGLLAIRFRRSLALLIALGAGLLLGAAFLDLLPEAILLGEPTGFNPTNVLGVALISFLLCLALGNGLDALAARWESTAFSRRTIGRIGGTMLIFHSFRDGMAIGLAYAASHEAGYAVAAGIAAHDLGDGMNTVLLTSGGEHAQPADYAFLIADAVAPLLGGMATVWWTFSTKSSVILLAIAAGFFIQLATSDFLPEARRREGPRTAIMAAVFLGSAGIYVANLLIGHLH